ncbi:MAG: DMT family transporter [bacterium]
MKELHKKRIMTWFILAILSCFLYAIVTVLNKFLLRQRATTRPLVFTFWLGVLSIFSFVLAPFGLAWPGWPAFLFDILVGLIYFASILYFYEALDINEASRASSFVGGLTPIFVLLLSYVFLAETLTGMQLGAFSLLVAGGFLISMKRSRGAIKQGMKGFLFIFLTIVLGAIYWIMAKYIFGSQGFITGFVWSRLGFVLASALVLIHSKWRHMIFVSERQATPKIGGLFASSKMLAAFGSLSIHLALSYGNASIVSALQGVQYVFLLIFAIFLSKEFPEFLEEKISAGIIAQKIIAILLIGGGLAILAM